MFEDFPNADENTALSLLHLLGIVAFMFVDSHLLDQPLKKIQSYPTFHDSLPALQDCTTSSIIAQNLNAIAAARKAFVHGENSAKVRKALKHSVRQYCDVVFKPNDKVFYQLTTNRRWQGSARTTVFEIDSKVILIKQGSVLRRV